MKQLPEKYTKIWRYMTDSNAPINEGRIAGMLSELFLSRLGETKDILKSNIKTMKLRENFDLRGDGWMQSLVQNWEHTFMPDLSDELKRIKAIPDIKDRAPAMREFLRDLSTGTTPMNVLSIMEDEFRAGREQLHDPVPEGGDDFVEDTGPGFLRRTTGGAARMAGRGALAATGALAMSGRDAPMLATMARGALGAFGLAKVAGRAVKTRVAGSSRLQSSVLGKVFGVGKSGAQVRAKATDFTPKEEQLEGGGIQATLQKIEENTAKMLELFAGKGMKGDKEDGGGLLGNISSIMSKVGSSLLSLLAGPAMMAVMATLGAALAVAFGAAAYKYLCEKFPALCPNKNTIFDAMEKAIVHPVKDFAEKANEFTGRTDTVEARRGRQAGAVMNITQNEEAAKAALEKLEFKQLRGPAKKLTKEQISGVLGGMKRENSQLDPTATNTKSGAFGVLQLLGDRKDHFFKWAKKTGQDPNKIETQVAFIGEEYSTDEFVMKKGKSGKAYKGYLSEKPALTKVLKAESAEDVAEVYGESYMRPFDSSWTPEMRAKYTREARNYASKFEGKRLSDEGLVKSSPAFIPKGSNEEQRSKVLVNLDNQIAAAKTPEAKAQLIKVRDDLLKTPAFANISAKPKAAPTLEVPASAAPSSSGSGAPIIVNPAPTAKESGNLAPMNVSKFNDDRSLLAQMKDSGNVMFPQFS